MKYMVAFLSLFCCVLYADQIQKYITLTYPVQQQESLVQQEFLVTLEAAIEVGSFLTLLQTMKNDLSFHEDADDLLSSVAAYYDRLAYTEDPVLYNEFFSQALHLMDGITAYCTTCAERGEVAAGEYDFVRTLLSYSNRMAGFLHKVSMELGQDSFAQELQAIREALQSYIDQEAQRGEVRVSREGEALAEGKGQSAHNACDLTEAFPILSIIKKRIANLRELMIEKFEQTWVILERIERDVVDTRTILSGKFNETWTILASIGEDFQDRCTALESRFDETWTILADIDQDIFDTQTILCNNFDETWTILADIDVDLADCCTTLQTKFDETWTILADIDQDIFDTQTILGNKFDETWTVLATIACECDFSSVFTALADFDTDITDCYTTLDDNFDQTWTILHDILDCCTTIEADECNTAVPISTSTIITSSGIYCLTQDIVGISGAITFTVDADNVVFDLNHKKISGGSNGIKVDMHKDIIIKDGIVAGASSNGVLITTCSNIAIADIDFVANGTGIYIQTTTCAFVEHSTFRGAHSDAIVLDESNNAVIQDNRMREYRNNGILVRNGSRNNQILKNMCNGVSPSFNGIQIISSANNMVSENICHNNFEKFDDGNGDVVIGAGIGLVQSGANIISENICKENGNGITVFSNSANNMIWRNICNNNGQNPSNFQSSNAGINNDSFSADNTIAENICNQNSGGSFLNSGGIFDLAGKETGNECNNNARVGVNDFGGTPKIYNNSAIDNAYSNYLNAPVQQLPGASLLVGSNFKDV